MAQKDVRGSFMQKKKIKIAKQIKSKPKHTQIQTKQNKPKNQFVKSGLIYNSM